MQSAGYLVPIPEFDAVIHSVFARTCNMACGEGLLTLVHHRSADGPTTLRLARGPATDLRRLFRAGDRWHCRDEIVAMPGLVLDFRGASVWRPAPPSARVDASERDARLRLAADTLARWRRSRSSVVDREGSGVVAGLREACRNLDADAAARCVHRLVGWGEGLTPAGDDVLVGLRAALGAQVDGRENRARFLLELSAAMTAEAHRTTPIAAHFLRLAARGHFNADVSRLVDALLGTHAAADTADSLAISLATALESGATSGADMVTGMITGLTAWP